VLIAVAGPYSAETHQQRQRNLDAINQAAADVMRLGHIPVVGVNAALHVVECLGQDANRYEAIMAISIALVDKCDAILIIGESAGVKRELDVIEAKGLPVYRKLKDVPVTSSLPAS